MKFFYPLVLLLFITQHVQSQSLEFAPAQGNPRLKSFAAQEMVEQSSTVERMTGTKPDLTNPARNTEDCPPEFLGHLVESGKKIVVTLDTFGLGKDQTAPVLTVLNAGALQFGTADITNGTIKLNYTANPGLTGAGIDTVVIGFSQPAGDTSLRVPIHVKRKGQTVIANAKTVDPETITKYCFSDLVDFPKPASCSEFVRCPNPYDGGGAQLYHFTSYAIPDTCVVYYASRFPGTDTVCVLMCDEWAVCDTFKIPFKIQNDTIKTLPFFDDFSSYAGPYPSKNFWLDKNVYVNSTLAKNPPSVGFVTFDGLDRRGDVYDIVEGVGDRLTSKPIDLSGLTPASNVVLRYFVAPKGYGLEPEEDDVFVLEFRNAQREWIPMDSIMGIDDVSIDSFPPFKFYAVAVADPQFLHSAFQFRFSANTSPGGEVDLWHLDYIYLDKQSTVTDFFGDFAFSSVTHSILKNYTAIPLNHLKADLENEIVKPNDTLRLSVFNHFNNVVNFSDSRVNFRETTGNQLFGQNFTLADANASSTEPKKHREIARSVPSVISDLKNSVNSIPDGDFRNLQSVFVFEPNTGEDAIFKFNDTVRINNNFSNYFAHDDGTAEWQFFIKSAAGGEQIATQYHANVDDSLKAIQIMFPHVNGNVQNQLFSLRVWVGSLDSEPVFERELLKPFYPNNVLDTLQGFTTYVLNNFSGDETPVFIPKGDFFIGIQQGSVAPLGIPIGYDLQNACDCNWSNISGAWQKFPSKYPGSLMMRPVFGQIHATSSNSSDVLHSEGVVKIFPNPTTGKLNFQLKKGNFADYKVFVFNELGQMVAQQPMSAEMNLRNLNDGIYFLQILDEKSGAIFSHRVLLTSGRP
jgi:hypothetical protein